MARARRAWLLLAAAATGAACAQVLGLQTWDAGAGGEATTTSSTGGQAASTSSTSSTSSSSTSSTATSSTSTSATSSAGSTSSSSSSASSSSTGSSSSGVLCSTQDPGCDNCKACANASSSCVGAYMSCLNTDADAGGCAAALDCLTGCGDNVACSNCPAEETATPKKFPTYQTCLCQQCAAACTNWGTAVCH